MTGMLIDDGPDLTRANNTKRALTKIVDAAELLEQAKPLLDFNSPRERRVDEALVRLTEARQTLY